MMPSEQGLYQLVMTVCCIIIQSVTYTTASSVCPTPALRDHVKPECFEFTYGNEEQHEIYSPLYPAFYPNSTECIHLLTAPEHHTIKIDFRDVFHIEVSKDCEYDFLEVRDGPFGYSKLINRFCGEAYPPILYSNSRYMWLRFKADENIQYKGFRMVYQFVPTPALGNNTVSQSKHNLTALFNDKSVCLIPRCLSQPEGFISSTDMPVRFIEHSNSTGQPLDCTWMLLAHQSHMVYLVFHELSVPSGDKCSSNYIQMFDGSTAVTSKDDKTKICSDSTNDIKSKHNHFYIRLYSKRDVPVPKFNIFYTVFKEKKIGIIDEPCGDEYFDCGDQSCINKTLKCNTRRNCGLNLDERQCPSEPEYTPAPATSFLVPHYMVILGIVSGLVVTVIIISVVITCKQKSREEALRKEARQHAETLNASMEMATLLNKSPRATHTIRSNNSPVMNHVTRLSVKPNGNGINLPNEMHQRIGRSVSNNPSENEGSEIDMGEGTFRRYLDVNNYNDEDSSPNPSTCNTIPALVTVEHHPSPRSLSIDAGSTPRDKAPSPRPDVVQEERFTYPDPPPGIAAQAQERTLQTHVTPATSHDSKLASNRPVSGPGSSKKTSIAKATNNNSGSFKSHASQDGPFRSANKASSQNKPAQGPNRQTAAIATALSPRSPDITKATKPYAGLKVTNVDDPDDTIIITDTRPVTSFKPLPPKRTSSTGSPAKLDRRSDSMQDGRLKPFASNHTPSPPSHNVWQHHPV